jgi:hypothetical protein
MHLNVLDEDYYFDVSGENEGRSNGQKYSMVFDAGRIFTDEMKFKKIFHSLDHDPMSNLDAKEGDVRVWSTELAPGHEYRINYTEFENRAVLRSSNVEWLKLVANVRYENRMGSHQGMTLSKCFSCHVTAMTRPVDETLTEVEPGIVIDKGRFGAEYHFLTNDKHWNYYDIYLNSFIGVQITRYFTLKADFINLTNEYSYSELLLMPYHINFSFNWLFFN